MSYWKRGNVHSSCHLNSNRIEMQIKMWALRENLFHSFDWLTQWKLFQCYSWSFFFCLLRYFKETDLRATSVISCGKKFSESKKWFDLEYARNPTGGFIRSRNHFPLKITLNRVKVKKKKKMRVPRARELMITATCSISETVPVTHRHCFHLGWYAHRFKNELPTTHSQRPRGRCVGLFKSRVIVLLVRDRRPR